MRTGFFIGATLLVGFAIAVGCSSSDSAPEANDVDSGSSTSSSTSSSSSSSSSSSGSGVMSSSGTVPTGVDTCDAGPADAAVAHDCTPKPVTYTFKAAAAHQNKCSAADIDAILTACVFTGTPQDCATAKTQHAACAACLIGEPCEATGHPLYITGPGISPIASTGICAAAYANDGLTPSDCSYAYGQQEICGNLSCAATCADADQGSYQSCLQASLSSICTDDSATFKSSACQAEYAGSKYGFCFSANFPDGGAMTTGQFYTAIAQLVCGSN